MPRLILTLGVRTILGAQTTSLQRGIPSMINDHRRPPHGLFLGMHSRNFLLKHGQILSLKALLLLVGATLLTNIIHTVEDTKPFSFASCFPVSYCLLPLFSSSLGAKLGLHFGFIDILSMILVL